MKNDPLPRLDENPEAREALLPQCRLAPGEVWEDAERGHRVGCMDATKTSHVDALFQGDKAQLVINDPPYNLIAFDQRSVEEFIEWSRLWIDESIRCMADDSNLYLWLGADQNEGFQPLTPAFDQHLRLQ